MLIVRSGSSAAARTPEFHRSSARGWSWLVTLANGRPSGAPGSVLLLMVFPSGCRWLFVEAEQCPQRCARLAHFGLRADRIERGHRRLDGEHRRIAAHGLAVLELAHLVACQD